MPFIKIDEAGFELRFSSFGSERCAKRTTPHHTTPLTALPITDYDVQTENIYYCHKVCLNAISWNLFI